jgi:hypothetical protein
MTVKELLGHSTVLVTMRYLHPNLEAKVQAVEWKADEAWAADIRRTRHIGDFRGWKDHDSYRKSFERLMRDLEANEKAAD